MHPVNITVGLIGKLNCLKSTSFLDRIAKDIVSICPQAKLVKDPWNYESVDFVVVVGGDGTILNFASKFPADRPIPPILPFSFGSLGFLLPFDASSGLLKKKILKLTIEGKLDIINRNRLKLEIFSQGSERENLVFSALNEVVVHRGSTPKVIRLDCSLVLNNGKKDKSVLLTDSITDGLIVATPTGSTAYSLSAGGPIVHPDIPAAILTPVCPRSLSFRPVVAPLDVHRKLQLKLSREHDNAIVAVDGKTILDKLTPEHTIKISNHPNPLRLFHKEDLDCDWAKKITQTLRWNWPFKERKISND